MQGLVAALKETAQMWSVGGRVQAQGRQARQQGVEGFICLSPREESARARRAPARGERPREGSARAESRADVEG